MNPPRQRFSLISFFTSSRNKKAHRLSKSSHNGEFAGGVAAAGPSTLGAGDASSAQSVPHSPTASVACGVSLGGDSTHLRECPICMEELPTSMFPTLSTCGHRSCEICLGRYLRTEISESRVHISCPECSERLRPRDIQRLLHSDHYMLKWEEFMLRRVLVADPDTRWCPAPDCGYAVIASGCANCPKIRCMREGCNTHFCYHCKQEWHPNQTCDAARRDRNMRVSFPEAMTMSQKEEIKPCPRCKSYIIKMDDGSCNHMTCAVCGSQFCWLCMKEISDLHFLSPSGCTFWGKKPWSRKKKLIWQLTILIGAPVGITVMAALTVPVFIVGIPIWAGRKLFQRYRQSNKHKRNLIVAGAATLAFTTAPLVAAVAVAIGVPILLTYIYGVVPISLCRSSGGCGLSADRGGLNFELEEAAAEGQQQPANPSIAPSIGEAASLGPSNSLSASGSHIDRMGMRDDQSDRDWASNKAMAGASLMGASLNGSIHDPDAAPAAAAAAIGNHHRLEIKADVSQRTEKRNSITSETPSVLEGRMTAGCTTAESMKGLAGSIFEQRDRDGYSMASSEYEAKSVTVTAPRPRSNHSSPVSNRSVTFAAAPEALCHSSSTKRHKRKKSASSGGSVNGSERSAAVGTTERGDHGATAKVRGDHGATAKVRGDHGATAKVFPINSTSQSDVGGETNSILKKNSMVEFRQHSSDVDTSSAERQINSSCMVGEEDVGNINMPEVDSDKPLPCHVPSSVRKTLSGPSAEPSALLGNIMEERRVDGTLHNPEVATQGTNGKQSILTRRNSCQMALENGMNV